MIIPKPPTSNKKVTSVVPKAMKSIVKVQVGCWGLPVFLMLLYCISLCDISYAARIPATASSPSDSGPVPAPSSNIRKRNANFHQQIALIRNATAPIRPAPEPPPAVVPHIPSPSAPVAPPPVVVPLIPSFAPVASTIPAATPRPQTLVPVAPAAAPTSPQALVTPLQNVSKNSSSNNVTKNDSLHKAPGAARIGQALLDSNYLFNDITVCGSEDCFDSEAIMHPRNIQPISSANPFEKRQYESAEYWRTSAFNELHKKLLQRPVEAVAKNIILFLGDGMSVPTVTAARILKGQQVDHMQFGEEGELHMDTFPYSGVSKTFCSDAQVADSACTATAYLCGVKANSGTIGLTPDVTKNNCTAQNEPAYRLSSILAWAQAAGKSTGVVTTARVTHASPAGAYANIANRNWENDHEIRKDGSNPNECDDIAEQLILREPGMNINVILGGGRLQFLPRTKTDPENGRRGFRTDGQNLIEMWKQGKFESGGYAYVEGREQLLQVDPTNVDYLLGLFAPSHMEYLHEQKKHDDPSLAEMTAIAIQILSKNPNGFFLFVEGARIDHAHHNNQGLRAIWETVEMDRAIKKADEMTHDEDSLILVTADHSHTFSLAGYPPRGNSISGIAEIALDNMPYTTLSYANGPAFKSFVNNKRYNISNDPLNDLKYKQIPNIPRKSETHGGDDVPVYSKGPFAHLFTGSMQQSYLPHAMAYAACIGPGPKFCDHVFY